MLPDLRTAIPGPRSQELAARLAKVESRNVTYLGNEFPVFWERAEGTNVWDADGNRFLDLTSAFAVASLGHCQPVLTEALTEQAGRLLHGMGDVHPTELKVRLCERLVELTFDRWGDKQGKCVLSSSGSEAVETALKTAHLATGKTGVLSFEGAYHGTGYGTLAAGAMPPFRDPFAGQLAKIGTIVPFGLAGLDAAEDAMKAEEIGAVLVEPILGRGGKMVPEDTYLNELRALCDRHGTLLIVDEIYTGFNRTGTMFACEHWQVVPDLICLGKALGGGMPLSACVGRAEVMDAWPPSSGEAIHTSTFLGHPGGCAVALAALDIHADPATSALVNERSARLRTSMEKVLPVRGLGLMLGVELPEAAAAGIVPAALKNGIISLTDGPGGRVLALAPAFTVSDEEIDYTAEWLQEYLGILLG